MLVPEEILKSNRIVIWKVLLKLVIANKLQHLLLVNLVFHSKSFCFFFLLFLEHSILSVCLCAAAAMTIAQQNTGLSTEDTMRDTDDWTRAVSGTGTGSRTEQPKTIILEISPRTCMTTDTAARESVSGTTRTGGRAAGVSTNEGGVEPGPIAPRPR